MCQHSAGEQAYFAARERRERRVAAEKCVAQERAATVARLTKRYPRTCPKAIALAVAEGDHDVDPMDEPMRPCADCTCATPEVP